MEKKAYIVPESTVENANIQIVCEIGVASGGGSGNGGTDVWAKKRNDIDSSEKQDTTWGNIW